MKKNNREKNIYNLHFQDLLIINLNCFFHFKKDEDFIRIINKEKFNTYLKNI